MKIGKERCSTEFANAIREELIREEQGKEV